MLILTGPSGSAKTALLRVLANELGFSIMEWINPAAVVWKDANGIF
jgi:cell cycle checkpoint protein